MLAEVDGVGNKKPEIMPHKAVIGVKSRKTSDQSPPSEPPRVIAEDDDDLGRTKIVAEGTKPKLLKVVERDSWSSCLFG